MPTREDEYTQVRVLLGFPKEQAPNPHSIVHGLIRQEQLMVNRLSNTRQSWTIETAEFDTVPGEAEYDIIGNTAPGGLGKALFAYRLLAGNTLQPVPFTDYGAEVMNQMYDFRLAPTEAGLNPQLTGEKLAFFRSSTGERRVRVFPVPTEQITYTVVGAMGVFDQDSFDFGAEPLIPEFSNYRALAVALFQLPYAEWEGYTREENRERRRELKEALAEQWKLEEFEFQSFITNPQHNSPGDYGYWWER
jgi:hypothetical protein